MIQRKAVKQAIMLLMMAQDRYKGKQGCTSRLKHNYKRNQGFMYVHSTGDGPSNV